MRYDIAPRIHYTLSYCCMILDLMLKGPLPLRGEGPERRGQGGVGARDRQPSEAAAHPRREDRWGG